MNINPDTGFPSGYRVVIIQSHSDWMEEGVALEAIVSTEDEAIAASEAAGYDVINVVGVYDSHDGPRIYGLEPDGNGAIGVAVLPR